MTRAHKMVARISLVFVIGVVGTAASAPTIDMPAQDAAFCTKIKVVAPPGELLEKFKSDPLEQFKSDDNDPLKQTKSPPGACRGNTGTWSGFECFGAPVDC